MTASSIAPPYVPNDVYGPGVVVVVAGVADGPIPAAESGAENDVEPNPDAVPTAPPPMLLQSDVDV
jgi:hypothetical protein